MQAWFEEHVAKDARSNGVHVRMVLLRNALYWAFNEVPGKFPPEIRPSLLKVWLFLFLSGVVRGTRREGAKEQRPPRADGAAATASTSSLSLSFSLSPPLSPSLPLSLSLPPPLSLSQVRVTLSLSQAWFEEQVAKEQRSKGIHVRMVPKP